MEDVVIVQLLSSDLKVLDLDLKDMRVKVISQVTCLPSTTVTCPVKRVFHEEVVHNQTSSHPRLDPTPSGLFTREGKDLFTRPPSFQILAKAQFFRHLTGLQRTYLAAIMDVRWSVACAVQLETVQWSSVRIATI